MAGYDMTFWTKPTLKQDVGRFLKFMQNYYKYYQLEFRYRTLDDGARLKVYITIDGKLPAMQHVERVYLSDLRTYLLTTVKAKQVEKYVILPFLVANIEGLESITNMVTTS